jgi:hypothetical protein
MISRRVLEWLKNISLWKANIAPYIFVSLCIFTSFVGEIIFPKSVAEYVGEGVLITPAFIPIIIFFNYWRTGHYAPFKRCIWSISLGILTIPVTLVLFWLGVAARSAAGLPL